MNPSAIPSASPNIASVIPESAYYNQDLASQNAPTTPHPVTPQPQPQQNQGSWWEKLLPTVGGIAGGILGGVADVASLGALAPLVNPVTGAALGGAAGQMGENALTNKPVFQGNDITSGLVNGAGELLGLGAGKALDAAGSAALKLGDHFAGKAADTADAAAKTAENTRLGNEFKLPAGNSDLASQTQGVVNKLNTLGYLNPTAQDASNVGQALTGVNDNGAGIYNGVKQGLLTQAGGKVNIGTAGDSLAGNMETPAAKLDAMLNDKSIQADIGSPSDTSPTKAGGILDKFYALSNGAHVNDAGQIAPEDAFSMLGKVQREAAKATADAAKASATPAQSTVADVWNNLAQNLKDSLYNRPEVEQAVSNFQVTPELSDQIDQRLAAEGITGPQADALKTEITNNLNNASSMQDILTPESQAVSLSKVGKAALAQQGNVAASSTQKLAKIAAGLEPDMMPAPRNNNGLVDMIAGAATKTHPVALAASAAKHIHAAGLTPKALNVIGKTMKATAELGAPAASKTAGKLGNGVIAPALTEGAFNLPNMASNSGSAIPVSNQQGASMNLGGGQATVNNPLQEAVNQALQVTQSPGAVLLPNYGNATALLSSLAPQAEKQVLAANSLNNLSPAFANAGGAQGFLGGLLDRTIGNFVPGSAQATFQNQSLAAASQLSAALGIPIQAAQAMLESQMQNPNSAAISQANQGSLLNNLTVPAQ